MSESGLPALCVVSSFASVVMNISVFKFWPFQGCEWLTDGNCPAKGCGSLCSGSLAYRNLTERDREGDKEREKDRLTAVGRRLVVMVC